jgi:UTP--glucose-1-phosphate uridylyltransferase
VLRETAQTLPNDQKALGDLDRHKYTSTNNIWVNLEALQTTLDGRDGVLGLPLIRNVKHVDPADASTPTVIQIESAMGAAIEIFPGARTIEVTRRRFVPVKTTNDLLVLRSDVYDIGEDFVLDPASNMIPFVDLDGVYKLVGDFDKRFKEGAPSLREAESFVVDGDWTFGDNVKVVGKVTLDGKRGRVESGTVLTS